jgi:hypothetical protein
MKHLGVFLCSQYSAPCSHIHAGIVFDCGLKFKEKINKILLFEHSLCGAETWALRKIDKKYPVSYKIWDWI